MTAGIGLTARQSRAVLRLIQAYLSGTAVWASGSRVKRTARPASDLDLVAFAQPGQRPQLAELREAFEESELPFRVDLLIWDQLPESCRAEIERERVVVAAGGGAGRRRDSELTRNSKGTE